LKRLESIVLPLIAGAALLAVWNLAVRWSGTRVFPSPLAVARGVRELAQTGLLFRYIRDSLMRVGVGFGLAAITAVPVGLAMGWYRTLAEVANPVVQLLRPISPLAWIPIAIILFGVTNGAAVFLIYLATFFPVVVSSMNAARNVPEIYLRAGRNFGLSNRQVLLRVLFPAVLPEVLTGLRLALGIAWLVVVAAEMIAVDSGLGYLILDARNAGKRYDLVVAGMVLIGLIGLALDVLLRRLERLKSVRWGFRAGA
jgi:NitT/TauT family transport system permease protein